MTKTIFQLTYFRQDHKELGAIASDPDSEHMFDIDDYDEIKSVHQRILGRVCNGKQAFIHKTFGTVHAELVMLFDIYIYSKLYLEYIFYCLGYQYNPLCKAFYLFYYRHSTLIAKCNAGL